MSRLMQMAPTRLLWTMIVLAGIGAAVPAHAKVSANLAKKCQAMAWQAHPAISGNNAPGSHRGRSGLALTLHLGVNTGPVVAGGLGAATR